MKPISWLKVLGATIFAVLLLLTQPVRALEGNRTDFNPLTSAPENAQMWNIRGYKLFRSGRFEEALLSYNHALLLNPQFSLVLANRCAVLSRLEKYSEALTSCNLALKGDGRWGSEGEALAWDNRGDALFNLERYEESLASFERALQSNPNYINAWWNRAIVLRKLGRSTELSSQDTIGGV
jgi:tetratricopeptide (TPR) repeat protein